MTPASYFTWNINFVFFTIIVCCKAVVPEGTVTAKHRREVLYVQYDTSRVQMTSIRKGGG